MSRDQRLVGKHENGVKSPRGAERRSHTTTRDLAGVQEHFLGLLLHPALLPRVLDRQILIRVSQGRVGGGMEWSQWGWFKGTAPALSLQWTWQ